MVRREGRANGWRGGFTLVEMLAVMAILSILITFTYLTYQDAVRKSRRVDAAAVLFRIQLEQERYRATHQHYAEGLMELGWTADEADSDGGYYRVSLQPVADSRMSFLAQASPRPGTDQINDACGALTINEHGPALGEAGREGCWPR